MEDVEQRPIMERLNEIAAQQGRQTWDPTKIEGFGPGDPPAPTDFVPRPPVDLSQVPDGPEYIDDEEDGDNIASPLIPKHEPMKDLPGPHDAGPQVTLEVPDLSVLGNDDAGTIAMYRGEQVELSPKEALAVRRIVSIAIARSFRARAAEFQTKKTRRRKPITAKEFVASLPPLHINEPTPPPKRKGRPRGSKNKPKDRQPGSEAQ